jgi:T5SS/PEP-CTERM-associated repeat protein
MKFLSALVYSLVTVSSLASTAWAVEKVTTNWTGEGGDDLWDNRKNWSNNLAHAGVMVTIQHPDAKVLFDSEKPVNCAGLVITEGSLNVEGGSLTALYEGIVLNGGSLQQTGGSLTAGEPGKFPRRLVVSSPESKFVFGGTAKERAPEVKILDSLLIGIQPSEGGSLEFSGYGSIEIAQNLEVGRYGSGSLKITGGGLQLRVGGNFVTGIGSKENVIHFVIDGTGISPIRVTKDVAIGGKEDNERKKNKTTLVLSCADGFRPAKGTVYTLIEIAGGSFVNMPVFGNAPEGEVITTDNGTAFEINYTTRGLTATVR